MIAIVSAALLVAGGAAAAIIMGQGGTSGSTSSGSQSSRPPSQRATASASKRSVSASQGQSRAGGANSEVGPTSNSQANTYTIELPSNWNRTESDLPSSGSQTYYESLWLSPDGAQGLLIDEQPTNDDLHTSVSQIADGVGKQGGSVQSLRAQTVASYAGYALVFTTNRQRPDRVDFFFHAGGSDYALMGTANDFSTARSIVNNAVGNFATTQ